jgi:hypothetical protein
MIKKLIAFAGVAILFLHVQTAYAQGRGEGAVVIRENVSIYKASNGNELRDENLPIGFAVVGITTMMGSITAYQFEEENNRLHVFYVGLDESGEQKSVNRYGWIDRSAVSQFSYECGCKAPLENNKCFPLSQAGFVAMRYNACFKEGLNKKLSESRPKMDQVVSTQSAPTSGEKALTNDDVLALVKAGLDDEIIVSKIQQSTQESLDVTVETLIKLKTGGLSKSILDSMIKRAGQRK